MTAIQYLLLFSLVSNNLTNYGRRHFKLFTDCYVSWDTLYKNGRPQFGDLKTRSI